uniref:Uncharacterized protein n=1 Tax=Rhizophora mucronata TaxID=61149 RepID=A0A2P2PE03_RHIMU
MSSFFSYRRAKEKSTTIICDQ